MVKFTGYLPIATIIAGLAGGADYQFGRFTHSFRVSYQGFTTLISDANSWQLFYLQYNSWFHLL